MQSQILWNTIIAVHGPLGKKNRPPQKIKKIIPSLNNTVEFGSDHFIIRVYNIQLINLLNI